MPQDSDDLETPTGENTSDEAGEYPVITLPSNNIFDAIEAAKNKNFIDYITEFESIECFIKSALDQVDRIMLFAYWQTDDCKITETKTINIKDFTIESLLFLPYLTVLEVRK